MNCLICGSKMLTRNGPFGEFYYCRNGNHGTISVAKYNAIINSLPNDGCPMDDGDLFMRAMERTYAELNCGPKTELEELALFYVDSPAYDEDDFWQDIRPHG